MINAIFWTVYILVGLFTWVRNTRGFSWEMKYSRDAKPDVDDWGFGCFLAFFSGLFWPLWYAGRRALWIVKNVVWFASDRFASEKVNKIMPKGLPPIETLSERKDRILRETEREVLRLRGRRADLT